MTNDNQLVLHGFKLAISSLEGRLKACRAMPDLCLVNEIKLTKEILESLESQYEKLKQNKLDAEQAVFGK